MSKVQMPKIFSLGFFLLVLVGLTACEPPEGTLQLGAIAPSLKTKTLNDVGGDFSKITSYRYPDERMYQLSIDEALEKGLPIVLEFATPGHCTVCDKQLQMLKGLMNKYEGQALFLHMDQYQNPQAFITFRVKGDPWTFVIGADKKVVYKRAGSVLYGELDSAIQNVVGARG